MFESINWPLENVKIVHFAALTNHLPTFASQLVHLRFVPSTILPFLHKAIHGRRFMIFQNLNSLSSRGIKSCRTFGATETGVNND